MTAPDSASSPLERLREKLAGAADVASIRHAMMSYLSAAGVKMASYYHYPPIGAADFGPDIPVYTHGFPEDWVSTYRQEGMISLDPMPKVAARQTAPFRWSEIESLAQLSAAERTYLRRAQAAGFGDGLAVPVFGPKGRNGYFAIGYGKDGILPDHQGTSEMHWACQAVHLRYCDLILKALPETVSLSEREAQILGYVVRGLSNQMIAAKLNISANTVDTYVRRCFEKLDVHDRVTAGLRGLALGLVA